MELMLQQLVAHFYKLDFAKINSRSRRLKTITDDEILQLQSSDGECTYQRYSAPVSEDSDANVNVQAKQARESLRIR